MNAKNERGFTLVELSIVLVILGLLVGGVLAGQSLIKAAELRAVTSEHTNYKIAINTFREKYMALPGDMTNATAFWGEAEANPVDCAALTTAAAGTETCNGNGDGRMPNLADFAEADQFYEFFRFWQHLANAGLVEGTYSGVEGPDGFQDVQIGINIPRSRFNSAGWSAVSFGSGVLVWPGYYPLNYGNLVLYFGSDYPTLINYGTPLLAAEAYNIDTKADDGKPQSGRILSHPHSDRPDCVNAADDAYEVSATIPGCALMFLTN